MVEMTITREELAEALKDVPILFEVAETRGGQFDSRHAAFPIELSYALFDCVVDRRRLNWITKYRGSVQEAKEVVKETPWYMWPGDPPIISWDFRIRDPEADDGDTIIRGYD